MISSPYTYVFIFVLAHYVPISQSLVILCQKREAPVKSDNHTIIRLAKFQNFSTSNFYVFNPTPHHLLRHPSNPARARPFPCP